MTNFKIIFFVEYCRHVPLTRRRFSTPSLLWAACACTNGGDKWPSGVSLDAPPCLPPHGGLRYIPRSPVTCQLVIENFFLIFSLLQPKVLGNSSLCCSCFHFNTVSFDCVVLIFGINVLICFNFILQLKLIINFSFISVLNFLISGFVLNSLIFSVPKFRFVSILSFKWNLLYMCFSFRPLYF